LYADLRICIVRFLADVLDCTVWYRAHIAKSFTIIQI